MTSTEEQSEQIEFLYTVVKLTINEFLYLTDNLYLNNMSE